MEYPNTHVRNRFFILYRRSDTAEIAEKLYLLIVERFGSEAAFLDRRDIPLGTGFPEYLQFELERSCAVLVLIGEGWLKAKYESGPCKGQRRLDDLHDYVRLEIQTGLEQGIRVIPLLVGDTIIPTCEDLPEPLRALCQRHGFELPIKPTLENCGQLIAALFDELQDPFRDNEVINRENLYVYVSFHRFRNQPEPDWQPYNCRIANRFQQLLDGIWESGADCFPMYSYGTEWILRDAETEEAFAHIKMIEGKSEYVFRTNAYCRKSGSNPECSLLSTIP